jgi:hypothetical protein
LCPQKVLADSNNNNTIISRLKSDLKAFQEQQRKFPNILPNIESEGDSSNLEHIAKQLHIIRETAKTNGSYQPIGTLGEFTLLVKTEASMKEGFEFVENRFFVEHPQSKIKYSYNHGILAQDPEKACANFVNALTHIPELIEGYEHRNDDLIKPLPVLQDMVGKEWAKEEELRQLKGGLLKLESELKTVVEDVAKQFAGESDYQKKQLGANPGATRFQSIPKSNTVNPADYDFDVSGITETNAQEMQRIKEKAQAAGTFMKAPNGKPTKLNERQWLQVRTEAFKKWFGNWENDPEDASKIVDANGEPLPVAHSTDAEFTAFRDKQKNDSGWLGEGYYFFGERNLDGQYGENVMETFLNIRNPYYATDEDIERLSELNDNQASIDFTEELKGEGYDGVYYNGNLNQEAVAFSPSQIKSATENNGNFDEVSDDIRYQFIGEQGAANLDITEEVTTRMDNLGVAREMETAGKDAKAVKLATGWERGADGKWRYEIVDIEVNENLRKMGKGAITSLPLEDVISNTDELFSTYPKLKGVTVKVEEIEDAGAYWNVLRNEIVFNAKDYGEEWNRGAMIHEIQHAIQHIEGFAKGGNSEVLGNVHNSEMHKKWSDMLTAIHYIKDFGFYKGSVYSNSLSDFAREQVNSVSRMKPENAIKKLQAQADEYKSKANVYDRGTGHYKYHRMAGEVESRNAEKRMNMTPEERRASLAAETEDVAREDQIFLYNALGKQAMAEENSHISDKKFTPISRHQAEALAGLLKKSGLAKDVIFGQEVLQQVTEQWGISQELNALKSPTGEVYGAVKDGVVYIDDTKLNANTPIHEFGHLWNDFVKKDNPELWTKIVELTKETPYFKDLLGNPAYANLKDNDARADEAFAQALGDEGERVFHNNNIGNTFKERFRSLLREFWKWTGEKLGIRNLAPLQISKLTFEQAVKGAVADLTRGKAIPTRIGKVELSAEQRGKLANGDIIQMKGLTDRFGKKCTSIVQVRWNRQKSKIEFSKPIKNQQSHVQAQGIKI